MLEIPRKFLPLCIKILEIPRIFGTSKGSTPDRSRSRDPPRETIPVVPIAQPQAVTNVPDYMLPIMATAGVGHLTLDRSGTPSVGVAVPPRVAQASAHNIAEFFESFSQAQDREAKVKAIQQFTAELLNEPQESASPASQETANLNAPATTGVTRGRMSSSPALTHDATAASRESSSPQATEGQDVPKPFFSGFSPSFCSFEGHKGDVKTRAKPWYAPNSGWNAFRLIPRMTIQRKTKGQQLKGKIV